MISQLQQEYLTEADSRYRGLKCSLRLAAPLAVENYEWAPDAPETP